MKVLHNYSVHYVTINGDAILSRRNRVYLYSHRSSTIEELFSLKHKSVSQRLLNRGPFERLLRLEVSHILALDDGSMLIFFDGRILKVRDGHIMVDYLIKTCRTPLNVFHDPSRGVAWGDYVRLREAGCAHIYQSDDQGKSWRQSFTFDVGQVRHIHNIVFDEFRNHYWILTGDSDAESGIWASGDLSSVIPVLHGRQAYRAVSVIPTAEGLIIPTDSELEPNFIQFYSHESKEVQQVHPLTGSALYAGQVNEWMFVTTAYEPSQVNRLKRADLWYSRSGSRWQLLTSFRKDRLPVKYFRYPVIKIPSYEPDYSQDTYYFSTRSVDAGQNVLIYSGQEITDAWNEQS
jgi:hypothetical protein